MAVRTSIEAAEAAHFWGGLVNLPYFAVAWVQSWWSATLSVAIFNLVANIYPILHLRTVTLRFGAKPRPKSRQLTPPVFAARSLWLSWLHERNGRHHKPALVICPASVLHNWRREAERFTPHLKVLVLESGAARHNLRKQIPQYDLIVTNYALLRRDSGTLGGRSPLTVAAPRGLRTHFA